LLDGEGRALHAPRVKKASKSGWLALFAACSIAACKSACAQLLPSPQNGASSMSKERSKERLPGAPPIDAALADELEAALEAQGSAYRPRTHHLDDNGAPKFTNRLILETSPYLLQHAHNPVSWFSWGKEAFEAARALHRPILLSIGYATCHWCHVMESESFEDLEIATYINAHFIPIKVDREERPDVDGVYMNAVQLMNNGSGGWPMTVAMTPDGEPFFGATYIPARDGDRGSRIGFLTILKRLSEAYASDADHVFESAKQVSHYLRIGANAAPPQGVPGPSVIIGLARQLGARFDADNGGFIGAPKFPRPTDYGLLLRYWRRSGDDNALTIVTESLRAMMCGGIYDQIGGGFHRYSTDERWLVPHFEKMLYDQAELVSLLLEAHQATKEADFAQVARETLDYVLREMTSPEGAFYSATDADSEGIEGRFFVWTTAEARAVLPETTARAAIAYFGITDAGNFEGRSILHRPKADEDVAAELGITPAAFASEIGEAKRLLYEARKKRLPPIRDDKILAEWNGQMISSLARAAFILGEPRYAEAARRAASFVLEHMRVNGRLLRAHRQGQSKHTAVLEDYTAMIAAMIDLFEATAETKWLEEALALESVVEKHYLDAKHGGFFTTPDDGEPLLVREKPSYDGAQPSGTSVAVLNLLRLYELTTEARYRALAEKTLGAFGASLEHNPLEMPKLAAALDFALDKPKEVIVVGRDGDRGDALIDAVRKTFLPNRVIVIAEEGPPLERIQKLAPIIDNKRAIGQRPTAYVCTDRVCQAPTSSAEVLRKQLTLVEPLPLDKRIVLPHPLIR
jgi:uncharacterized protein